MHLFTCCCFHETFFKTTIIYCFKKQEIVNLLTSFRFHITSSYILDRVKRTLPSSLLQQMLKVTSLCTQVHLAAASNGISDINK
jgi:hypothetical protein